MLIGDKYSPWFKANVGVRQGCVLSPTLFNMFLEQIMIDTLCSFSSGVKIRGRQIITNLRFAGDIDLICSNEEDLRRLTSLLDITSRKYTEISSIDHTLIKLAKFGGTQQQKVRKETLERRNVSTKIEKLF